MNKAEEQLQYVWGQSQAKTNIIAFAHDNSHKKDFHAAMILRLEEAGEKVLEVPQDDFAIGIKEYNRELLLSFVTGTIKDWPSFVEYMTGEDYKKDEEKPNCRLYPTVLPCKGCSERDCEGYIPPDMEGHEVCEYCNDTKEVSAPHYSSKGDVPDCDTIKCPKCGVDDE